MKKKILALVALCTAIMGLVACGNTETSTEVTGTPAVQKQEETKGSSTSTEKKLSENNTTATEPTTAPTVEATVAPTEAPAVPTEVSWEESGMSYELFENPVDEFGRKTVAVIVTNNSDTTYYCNHPGLRLNPFSLEPNGKWYEVFSNTDEAKEFINNLETTSKFKPLSNNVLTTELECTVTNVTNHDNYISIEIKSNDIVKVFNAYNNLNVTYDEFLDAAYSFRMDLIDTYYPFGTCILYNSNNEIVAIYGIGLDIYGNDDTEEAEYRFGVSIPSDLEYSKITMVMQYAWNDGVFE